MWNFCKATTTTTTTEKHADSQRNDKDLCGFYFGQSEHSTLL